MLTNNVLDLFELSRNLNCLSYCNLSFNFSTDMCTNQNVTYPVCCVQRSLTKECVRKLNVWMFKQSSVIFFSYFQARNSIHCKTFLHVLWVSNFQMFSLEVLFLLKTKVFLKKNSRMFLFYFKEAKAISQQKRFNFRGFFLFLSNVVYWISLE